MADNKNIVSEATTVLFKVATDELTYSGDTVQVQLNRLVHVTGAEGSKVLTELIRLEDAAATSGDPGIPIFAVRADTAASSSGTDGDYSNLITDASGRLHVNVGAFTPGTGGASLGKAEDAGHTSGDVGVMALSVRQDTAAATAGTDADYQPLITDANGRLHVNVGTLVTLPAGTNAIGKLAANSGVDIGDVDVTSLVPGTAAASLGKAEDAAHVSGDTGVMMLAVRQDSQTALAANGDYMPPTIDAVGGMRVSIVAGAGTGGTSMTDDAAFTVAVTGINPVGGTYRSVRDAVDDNDGGAFAMTAKRGQYVTLETPLAVSTMDETAGAVKALIVDATGAAVATAVDRLTDNIGVALQTDVILNDTTALTPKFAYVTISASSTDTSIIAAVSSKKLRILSGAFMCGATATDLTLESDGGSDTALHKITAGANGGQVLGFNPVGWFETLSGEALIGTTGSGSTYQITLTYVEV